MQDALPTPEATPDPFAGISPSALEANRRALPHAIPFRWLFLEFWARRPEEMKQQIREAFRKENTSQVVEIIDGQPQSITKTEIIEVAPGEERATLDAAIEASRASYESLLRSKEEKTYCDWDEQRCQEADHNLLKVLHGMQSSALCLSGGGIRSASFCLGVLQGMARFGFSDDPAAKPQDHALCQLDYLSTVSGGGYIGSWLMAWTKRLADPPLSDKEEERRRKAAQDSHLWRRIKRGVRRICHLPPIPRVKKTAPVPRPKTADAPARAFHNVVRGLAGKASRTSGDPAPRAIRHLRDYTSFLAPKVGLTLDTWTLAAIVFRNLLVNWAMMLPLFLVAIAAIQVVRFGLFRLASLIVMTYEFTGPFIVATLLFMFAGVMAGLRMPSRKVEKLLGYKWEPSTVGLLFVLPLALGSVILMALWLQFHRVWGSRGPQLILWFAVSSFISFALVPIVRTRFTDEPNMQYPRPVRYWTGIAAAAAAGPLLALALFGVGTQAESWLHESRTNVAHAQTFHRVPVVDNSMLSLINPSFHARPASGRNIAADRKEVNWNLGNTGTDRFLVFGFPLVWGLLMSSSALFSGFLGIYEEDIDREWWARSGGLMMYLLLFWTVSMSMVIYSPRFVENIHALGKLSGAGLITGLLGAFGGFSTTGGIGPKKNADVSAIGSFLNRYGLIVPALCFVTLFSLAVLLTNFEIKLAALVSVFVRQPANDPTAFDAHLVILIASAVLGVLINWAVNINIFSLHGMYRMRLMRAFLGASNTRREPDSFTGFDDRDLVWEVDVPCGPNVPLHIINCAVNLVGTRELAWSQRKAEGFTFSPLFSGGWRLGYVPTATYGSKHGVSLATAMAISGAAFNPNMGYHSSPLVTFIMTLFNVRLGWWLPNPKYERSLVQRTFAKWLKISISDLMSKKSPRLALRPLVKELLGGTNDTTAYIELSDGGHFENLGIYEMVLRRVKTIVVVDSGADPECEFEDLGNAMRKIEIDLGIPIEFRGNIIPMEKGIVPTNMRCAIADIQYACVDGTAAKQPGTLIYIKAGLNGQEPPDIMQYAKTHTTFPHESTANQFFNESQFESYRHLGSFAVDQIVDGAASVCRANKQAPPHDTSLLGFIRLAEIYTGSQGPGTPVAP